MTNDESERFVGALCRFALPGCWNPLTGVAGGPEAQSLASDRAHRLQRWLRAEQVDVIFVFDYLGQFGNIDSGIPFVSLGMVQGGVVPRCRHEDLQHQALKLDIGASALWQSLLRLGVASRVLFWPLLPIVPVRPRKHVDVPSLRAPTDDELDAGLPYLLTLTAAHFSATVAPVTTRSANYLQQCPEVTERIVEVPNPNRTPTLELHTRIAALCADSRE